MMAKGKKYDERLLCFTKIQFFFHFTLPSISLGFGGALIQINLKQKEIFLLNIQPLQTSTSKNNSITFVGSGPVQE